MTFTECVKFCAGVPSFVAEFDRLTGSQLSRVGRQAPINQMIDDATGFTDAQLARFCAFVYECVWVRFPRDPENPHEILTGDERPVAREGE